MNTKLSTVFCDDVRQEVRNKLTLVGTYSTLIFFQSFPALMNQLCAVMSLNIPLNVEVESLTFEVLIDGRVNSKLDIPPEEYAAQAKIEKDRYGDGCDIVQLGVVMQMINLQFVKDTMLTTRAVLNGEVISGDKIKATVAVDANTL
jgi:hypothetical protein